MSGSNLPAAAAQQPTPVTSVPQNAGSRLREVGGGFGRWLQRSMSRENLIAGIKTLAWLGPLTLLIWIYAEREQVYTTPPPGEVIPIDVESGDSNRFVELQMNERDQSVQARLSGPRTRVEEARRKMQLNPKTSRPSVVITVPKHLSPGQTHDLDTETVLSAHPIFASGGVTVTDCKPATIKVLIDEYIEREVTVEVPPNVTNLASAPIFTPAKVTVRGPRRTLMARGEPIRVFADLRATGALDKPGQPEPVTARVYSEDLPPQLGNVITYLPDKVQATLDVRQLDETETIASVPIFPQGPIDVLANYRVRCQEERKAIPNLKVIGPPDQIAKLRNERGAGVIAVLRVSSEDANNEPRSAPLRIMFPEGAENCREATPQSIEFQLVRKTGDE
jgi:hypothetical protein